MPKLWTKSCDDSEDSNNSLCLRAKDSTGKQPLTGLEGCGGGDGWVREVKGHIPSRGNSWGKGSKPWQGLVGLENSRLSEWQDPSGDGGGGGAGGRLMQGQDEG